MNKEEILEEITKTKEQLAKLQEALKDKEYERWRPKLGETYYYTTSTNGIPTADWNDYDVDNSRYDIGNCFETEQEAKAELEKTLIRRQLEDIAKRLNKGEEINWNNCHQFKHFIFYSYEMNCLDGDLNCKNRIQGVVYCLSHEFLNRAIKEIGEERLTRYLKGEF